MTKSLWPPHKRPSGCDGCPRNMPKRSRGFVPGYGNLEAKLVVLGEQPGENEVVEGRPFVGQSGKELTTGLGKMSRADVFITNVRKCIGPTGESRGVRDASIAHCMKAYLAPEFAACTKTETVLAVGADALRATTGLHSAIKYHGSVFTAAEAESMSKELSDV